MLKINLDPKGLAVAFGVAYSGELALNIYTSVKLARMERKYVAARTLSNLYAKKLRDAEIYLDDFEQIAVAELGEILNLS